METGLYYLQSRYYDPEIGRFINADAFVATGQDLMGNNMFAYCGNNPVNKADPKGTVSVCVVGAILFIAACLNNENQMAYEASSGKSDLSSTSYSDGSHKKLTRQEKMDYTKQQTGDSKYTTNAWRFQAEYTLHEIGWKLTGWAYDTKVPVLSDLANKFISAEVDPHAWDERWYVNVGTVIVGLLGL